MRRSQGRQACRLAAFLLHPPTVFLQDPPLARRQAVLPFAVELFQHRIGLVIQDLLAASPGHGL